MQTGGIKNNQLEVSSEAQGYEKDHSRLQGLGWCALTSSVIMAPGKVPYHYLQIDLLVPHFIRGVGTQGKRTLVDQPEAVTSFYLLYSFIGDEWFRYHMAKLSSESIVTGVATQGQKSSDSWVKYFSLDYSLDDRAWIQYAGGKVITGNVDRNSTVFHFFSTSLVTRYLRFHTQSWHNKICMRVGIYGCAVNDRRAVSAGRPSDVSDCAQCNVNARCISSQGNTGRCVCKHGFVGDGKKCEGTSCMPFVFGAFFALCLSGFPTAQTQDLDVCVRYNYNAASLATVDRKRFCLTDRDECSSSISPCPEQADCENALGSFRCLCRPGYKGTDSQNSSCVDIDECKISGSCFRVGCINFPGSFKCDCGITGLFYDPQDRNCKDIDECSDGSFECNPLASCINTYGSYACICPDGYKGGGRRVCADVNECRRRPNPCGNTTVCQNTKGSYRCGCRAGFIWQNNTCVDIDECSIGAFKCRVHTECVNTIGSYTCKCKQGFYSNGPHCLDFNECLRGGADCHEDAWCTNTAGSYKCFCKEGYHGNGTSCERDDLPRKLAGTTARILQKVHFR
ncbi:unnamed protein product, partial [Porites evermanni]